MNKTSQLLVSEQAITMYRWLVTQMHKRVWKECWKKLLQEHRWLSRTKWKDEGQSKGESKGHNEGHNEGQGQSIGQHEGQGQHKGKGKTNWWWCLSERCRSDGKMDVNRWRKLQNGKVLWNSTNRCYELQFQSYYTNHHAVK